MTDDTHYPKLVAFDLDYTLWDLWIDTHITSPLKRNGTEQNVVTDRGSFGVPISFYKDVPEILNGLSGSKVHIAACSRTHAPELAREALGLLLVPPPKGSEDTPRTAMSFFDSKEIYPGSKIKHFEQLHKKTGIDYADMLFFDDEKRNKEVEKLGVTFVLVRRELDIKTYEGGIKEWRRRHPEPFTDNETTS